MEKLKEVSLRLSVTRVMIIWLGFFSLFYLFILIVIDLQLDGNNMKAVRLSI